MSDHYDIAVLGSGPGGYIAALKAAQQGARVAVAEKHLLGGTCLNYGCIPSKALLASAELLHRIHGADAMGVRVDGSVGFDWTRIQQRKDNVVQTLRRGVASLFSARGVTLFEGHARLTAPGKVAVTSEGKPARELTADSVILAVGSVPAHLPGWPSDPNVVCTSDEALHWPELPRRLLIVGGGVIGCEFACMLHAFGVEVTIVEMLPRILPEMDADLGDALAEVFRKRGLTFFTGTKVQELKTSQAGVEAVLDSGQTIRADKVLLAVGRRAATDDVGLQAAGIETDRGFVRVDDGMATPVRGHFCIGDANGRCLLAHAASAHGVVAVHNALGRETTFGAPVPWCVYTFPEVAGVGLTRKQARQRGLPVAVGSFPLGYLGKAMAVGEADGFVKVLRHRETDELLGVHMIGHNVTEVIASAAAMLGQKVRVADVADSVVAHPTIAEAFKEAAEDALGAALNLPPRKVVRVAAGG